MNVSPLTCFVGRRRFALALSAALSVVAISSASAQLSGGPVGSMGKRRVPDNEKPPEPPPDAIPGAKPRGAAVPAYRSSGDMQPTDALFDAINRGDIASARDALNRGADLNGVNILGMTPMELSVDLGRNDISFLLLSMRGEDSGRGSRAIGRDAASGTPANNIAQAGKPAATGKSGPSKGGPGRADQAVTSPNTPRPVATPKLFANDGGTPVPSAGFLGFDSRAAAN
jgi:hypothetical protein